MEAEEADVSSHFLAGFGGKKKKEAPKPTITMMQQGATQMQTAQDKN